MPPNVTWFEVCIAYAARNAILRWKVTKLNNGVRGQKNTPPEYLIFWENVSVFSLCVIINPSFSLRHEIGMVLAFLTSSNSRLKLHIFGNYLQTNWSIEMISTPKCLFRQGLLISASLILQICPPNNTENVVFVPFTYRFSQQSVDLLYIVGAFRNWIINLA